MLVSLLLSLIIFTPFALTFLLLTSNKQIFAEELVFVGGERPQRHISDLFLQK